MIRHVFQAASAAALVLVGCTQAPPPVQQLALFDGEIMANSPAGYCVDPATSNAAEGFAYDANAGETSPQQSEPQDDPLAPDRNGVGGVDAIERSVLSSTDSDPITQRLAQEAQVSEASWFVTVECTANVAQLNKVLFPHDIVSVANAGAQLEGPYQVTKVLHVITSEAHLSDFTIRANGLRSV